MVTGLETQLMSLRSVFMRCAPTTSSVPLECHHITVLNLY